MCVRRDSVPAVTRTTYVALLRGINVGGKNIVRMADLRTAFEDGAYTAVSTYIQSGNVLYEFSRLSERLSQSRMSRIASTPQYQNMTIRNWRTTTRLLSLLNERSTAPGA